MSDEVPKAYTTLTVDAYNNLAATIRHLRKRMQTVREHLEKGEASEALKIARFEEDHT